MAIKMKRVLAILLLTLTIFGCCSCGKMMDNTDDNTNRVESPDDNNGNNNGNNNNGNNNNGNNNNGDNNNGENATPTPDPVSPSPTLPNLSPDNSPSPVLPNVTPSDLLPDTQK